jgi:hypothetical protein
MRVEMHHERMHYQGVAVLLAGLAVLTTGAGALGAVPSGQGKRLPAGALRGPEDRLRQYPTVSLANGSQREAAKRLRREIRAISRGWRNPRAAAAAGYDTARLRRGGDAAGLYLHAEHRGNSNDGRYLQPRQPEALIFANVPGKPLVLVGFMFAVPRGVRGPTPGGPITRWHTHRVCVRGHERGRAPRPDGSCPRGSTARQGSEMLHFWLTRDLRSAYAIHGPAPELCAAGLLPHERCHHVGH